MAKGLILRDVDISSVASPFDVPLDLSTDFTQSQLNGYRIIGTVVLGAPYVIQATGTAYKNQKVVILWEANASGNTVTILGTTLPTQLLTKDFIAYCTYNGSAWKVKFLPSFDEDGIVQTADIEDLAVTTGKIAALAVTTAKLEAGGAGIGVTNAKMAEMPTVTVKGNDGAGPAVPQDLTMTEVRTILDQDVTLTGDVTGTATQTFATGVTTIATTIAAGAVDTAMIADDQVTVAKVENNLTYEVINLLVSFEAAGGTTPSVGDFKIKMPYPGTVSEIYGYVVKAIANTDAGTIQAKNNAGTNMTAGLITCAISDARGTAYTVSPSADNTFAAGDILTFTTAKTTAGGLVQLSIKVTRS